MKNLTGGRLIMYIAGDNVLTKTEALRFIEIEFGFPKPAVKYITLFFREDNNKYLIRVNVDSLKEEIETKGLVAKMASVVNLPESDKERKKVVNDIQMVVRKHQNS